MDEDDIKQLAIYSGRQNEVLNVMGIDQEWRLILYALAQGGPPWTKAQLAAHTRLPRTTMNYRIDALRDAGWLNSTRAESGLYYFSLKQQLGDLIWECIAEVSRACCGETPGLSKQLSERLDGLPKPQKRFKNFYRIDEELQRLHYSPLSFSVG